MCQVPDNRQSENVRSSAASKPQSPLPRPDAAKVAVGKRLL